ncbi:MAG TPA: hypothetical protein VJZ71_07010 [Phycisphaerae bacterium]|nr:hypothetical protein [Phycisphaerae bacterium]
MFKSKQRVLVMIVATLATASAGCGVSDLASAASKLANGQIGALTASEIRSLSEAAIALLKSQDPNFALQPLNEAQAEALVNFLDVNEVETQQDLDALVANADTDPPVGLDELANAFGNVDPDNADPEDLEQVLEQAFGVN